MSGEKKQDYKARPDQLKILKKRLKSPDVRKRATAASALSEHGPETIPDLAERLKDSSLQVKIAAAKSLVKLGDERGMPELIKLAIFHEPGRTGLEGESPVSPEMWVAREARKAIVEVAKGEHLSLLIKAHEEVETDEARKIIEEVMKAVTGEKKDA